MAETWVGTGSYPSTQPHKSRSRCLLVSHSQTTPSVPPESVVWLRETKPDVYTGTFID